MSIYRNNLWNEKITVYHRTEELVSGKKVVSWTRSVYEECFWKLEKQQVLGGTTIVKNQRYIVRIPFDKNPSVDIELGDIVIKGEVEDEITGTTTALTNKYQDNSFMVNSFTDNTKMKFTAHWLLSDTK